MCFAIFLVSIALCDFFSPTPDEVVECFLAGDHLCDISPVQAIDTVGAHEARLLLLNFTFFGEVVPCLMVDSETLEVVLIDIFEEL